jgi:hypothetical protein
LGSICIRRGFISPGATIKLYPLFFMDSQSIFLRETAAYSLMWRNMHDSSEKGSDVGVLSTLGFEFSIAERWGVIPYFGEKHYLGGIDMFLFGLEIAYRR